MPKFKLGEVVYFVIKNNRNLDFYVGTIVGISKDLALNEFFYIISSERRRTTEIISENNISIEQEELFKRTE